MIPTVEQPTARARKRPGAKAQERKGAERTRCTLTLSADTDLKLSVLAMMRGLDRSELAEQVLAAAVRGVVVSLRGALSAPSDIGEDRHESAA